MRVHLKHPFLRAFRPKGSAVGTSDKFLLSTRRFQIFLTFSLLLFRVKENIKNESVQYLIWLSFPPWSGQVDFVVETTRVW